jgi:diaminohydroxyphosphoribosylaminopyrimidine deaminase/5-amino-6-(5-phosphoribosylamino)uracil reductase
MRVVLGPSCGCNTPPTARLLAPPGRGVWIYAAVDDPAARTALQAQGAEVTLMPGSGDKVDLAALLQDLARRGVNELHVEAGHKLNASLLRTGLVDELLIYMAPRLLGPGRDMAALAPLQSLGDSLNYQYTDVQRIGDDLRIMARPPGRENF